MRGSNGALHRACWLLAGALVLTGPTGCQTDLRGEQLRAYVAGGDAQRGERHFGRYGCIACHTIPGVRGARGLVGPPLTSWPQRGYIAGMVPNEPARLVEFIRDPQRVAPGTAMPDLGVSDQDARDMAAYLYTLD